MTKPLALFIKYLSYGEDTAGILDVRKKRAVSFLPEKAVSSECYASFLGGSKRIYTKQKISERNLASLLALLVTEREEKQSSLSHY